MNQKQIDIAEWLLAHGDELLKDINKRHHPATHLFPNFLYETYCNIYEDNVLDILRNEVGKAFNLNSEESHLLINKYYVIMVLGQKYLEPPK